MHSLYILPLRPAKAILMIVCLAGFVAIVAAQQPSPNYHLVKKVTLGGVGGWDYFTVDSATHRIFIPRGTHMMVLDSDGTLVKDIENMQGAHGIDLAPDLKRGFISNGAALSMTTFDMDSLAPIMSVSTPKRNPDSILYEPMSKRVFTFNAGAADDANAIDANTGKIEGKVMLGGKPESAQADGTGKVYVNIEDKNQIVQFDAATLKVINTWKIAPCIEPAGLAIDVAHKRLFAGCHNNVLVAVDYTTGKVVASVPIGQGVDANRFDPTTQLVFASCGDGTITVAHEDSPNKYTVVQTIKTQRGARTMALDTSNHNVYTVTSDLGPAPAATEKVPNPRPTVVPNTFTLLIYGR
jgi:DNA-binding beta-propeller fold protein YncE